MDNLFIVLGCIVGFFVFLKLFWGFRVIPNNRIAITEKWWPEPEPEAPEEEGSPKKQYSASLEGLPVAAPFIFHANLKGKSGPFKWHGNCLTEQKYTMK
jgi:hypothetical protein